jgi:hypothetical protein
MAVEITTTGGFGESVSLKGEDAARFVHEIENPSTDQRRLKHLKRSDKTYERLFSPEPLTHLPAGE